MITAIICAAVGVHVSSLEFKSEEVLHQFQHSSHSLKVVACDFARLANELGTTPVMTRVKEKVKGSSGVHESGRAVDFRGQYVGRHLYPLNTRHAIIYYLNVRYGRGDGRRTCMYHRFDKKSPYHFHCQIPRLAETLVGGN